MVNRAAHLWPIIGLLTAACGSSGASGGSGSLGPGPPPRPLFHQVEGLRWGMTPAEVQAAWGPGEEAKPYAYANKDGYARVSLGYNRIPKGDVVHTDLQRDPKDDRPGEFLVWVAFHGDATMKKETVRADLLARFGPPVTDAPLLKVRDCPSPRCELFRAAECTLVEARWNPANAQAGWPEHLESLTWLLAPDSLVQYVPRTEWAKLRGSVPASYSPETDAKFEKLGSVRGSEAATLGQIAAAVGPPNLRLETSPGKGTLYYLFLDGSLQTVSIEDGRYHGSTGSVRN